MLAQRCSNAPGPCTRPVPARPALRCVRVKGGRAGLLTTTGSRGTTVDRPCLPTLQPPVQRLWKGLEPTLAFLTRYRAPGSSTSIAGNKELVKLFRLDVSQPQLLAWHVLPRLRPYLEDVGGPVPTAYVLRYASRRAALHGDYSPLVWALGLQRPVGSSTSSPLPPPPDPPLSTAAARPLLAKTVWQVVYRRDRQNGFNMLQHLACVRLVVQQLQHARPELLADPVLPLQLWRLCCAAEERDMFWQMVQANPELQRGACSMVCEVHMWHMMPAAEGLVQLGLVTQCSPEDIWWWMARLDNAAKDKYQVLQMFDILAAASPQHPVLASLGAVLLQYLQNGRSTKTPGVSPPYAYPPSLGDFRRWYYKAVAKGLRSPQVAELGEAAALVVPHLTCSMSSAEVVDWLSRLQLVWSPQQTCGLLLQLLQAPTAPRALLKGDRLQLYDLLLLQVARPGWEPQQQAAAFPPAAADVVLGLLPKASSSRSAAVKVLVVWRHMAGALDPTWCGGGLAAAAKAVGEAVKKEQVQQQQQQQQQWQQEEQAHDKRGASTFIIPAGSHAAPSAGGQELQQLSVRGQQQVIGALEKLDLQLQQQLV